MERQAAQDTDEKSDSAEAENTHGCVLTRIIF